MKTSLAIVIPSYNDLDNIPLVLDAIYKEIPQVEIIIVDDSTPFEKKKLLSIRKTYPNVIIIERKQKSGRGTAVLEGFRYAIKNKNIAYVMEMDADTSHDAKDLPKFLAKKDAFDVIVGSRYVSGSHIINWPKKRLFLSHLINAVLLSSLFHLGIRDYTSGYRLYSRKATEYLLHTTLTESGFLLLSETAYKLKQAGFTFTEVPITFTDRKFGKSSVEFMDLVKNFFGAFRIRFLA